MTYSSILYVYNYLYFEGDSVLSNEILNSVLEQDFIDEPNNFVNEVTDDKLTVRIDQIMPRSVKIKGMLMVFRFQAVNNGSFIDISALSSTVDINEKIPMKYIQISTAE